MQERKLLPIRKTPRFRNWNWFRKPSGTIMCCNVWTSNNDTDILHPLQAYCLRKIAFSKILSPFLDVWYIWTCWIATVNFCRTFTKFEWNLALLSLRRESVEKTCHFAIIALGLLEHAPIHSTEKPFEIHSISRLLSASSTQLLERGIRLSEKLTVQ